MTWNAWLRVAVFSSLLCVRPSAAADFQLRGTLYKLGSNRQEKLYTWEMKVCPNVWTSRYRRLDGTLVVEDETRFIGQRQRFAEYSYVRHTIGERSSVKVKGSQLEFKYQRGNEIKSETLTTDGAFATGPAVFSLIQQHLRELRAGKEFEFEFGVLDRLDYFTFRLSDESRPGSKNSIIQIRASSLFVRMAVAPIYVTLSKEGKFRGIAGRSIVMEKIGKKRTPIDADLVVESEARIQCDLQKPQ
jgi:hypothetical protein